MDFYPSSAFERGETQRPGDPRSIPTMPTTPTNIKRDPFTSRGQAFAMLTSLAADPVVYNSTPIATPADMARALGDDWDIPLPSTWRHRTVTVRDHCVRFAELVATCKVELL